MNTTAILIIAIAAMLVLWLKDRKMLKTEHGEKIRELNEKIERLREAQNMIILPDTFFGVDLAYKYTDVELIPIAGLDAEELEKKEITFNFVDDQAIACIANKAIGAVSKRGIAYMIRDWLNAGDPIYAVFINAEELTCAVCFYKKGVAKKRAERTLTF